MPAPDAPSVRSWRDRATPPALVNLTVSASAVLWAVACCVPAISSRVIQTGEVYSDPGFWCAIWGPMVVFSGCPAWCANLSGAAAALYLSRRRYKAAILWTLLSLLLVASIVKLFAIDIPLDEGGVRRARPEHLRIGFWLWSMSLALPGVVGGWLQAQTR